MSLRIRVRAASCTRAPSAPPTHHSHVRAAIASRAAVSAPGGLRGRTCLLAGTQHRAFYSTKKSLLVEENMPPNWREQVRESLANFEKERPELERRMEAYREQSHLEGVEKALYSEQLRPDAPWGLVVYRTSYDDDVKWQKMRERLEADVQKNSEFFNDNGIFDRHRFVFMDDKAQFDNATPAQVRGHFEQWAKEELTRDWAMQPVTEDMYQEMYGPPDEPAHGAITWAGTRYNVCMLIDDVCLLSLDRGRGPIVMLVNKDPDSSFEVSEEDKDKHPDYEEGWMIDHNEGPGGWTYISMWDYVETYDALNDPNEWGERFLWPSIVYGEMGLERSPGFWRKEIAAKTEKTATNRD